MDRPWAAEREVSAALARASIEEQFPDLAPARVEPLGVGWDNSAFLVGGEWVFRFPRRASAADLVRTETAVLPALAPALPLAIPLPTRVGRPDARCPWPFAGYRRIPGTTADRARLDEARRARLAAPLARFLAALHAFPAEEAARLGAPLDTLGRLDVPRRRLQIEEHLGRAAEAGLVGDPTAWRAVLEDLPTGWSSRDDCLVHGDLYARHLLVDDEGAPTGVIDWGDLHRGDPAVDLSIAHGFLPPVAHPAFRAAYGPIDEGTWRMARLRALQSAAVVLVYGHEAGDRALIDEALTALGYMARWRGRVGR